MKRATSVTIWNDAVGKRISVTYSEIDENGRVAADNKRVDRVVTETDDKKTLNSALDIAQKFIDKIED